MLAQDKPANVLSRKNRHNLFTFSADVIKLDCFNCTSSTSALQGCDLEMAPYLKSRDNMTLSDALWDTILILLAYHNCFKMFSNLEIERRTILVSSKLIVLVLCPGHFS